MTLLTCCMLSIAIDKAALRYGVKREHLFVLAKIESGMNPLAPMRWNTNGTVDVGTFQINSIHREGLCREHNIDTLTGNTMCAAKLIKRHRRHRDTDEMWLARYHSKTPNLKRRYYKKIKKYRKVLLATTDEGLL